MSTVEMEGIFAPRKAPSNVLFVILQIAQTESFTAPYEGLRGEVMKGFFSHGITMIVKEIVHKLVIQLYYTILKMLKKSPSPQKLTGSVEEERRKMAENARNLTGSAKEQIGQTTQK